MLAETGISKKINLIFFLQRSCEPLIKETAPMLVFLFMEVVAGSAADGRMMWRLILCVGSALIFQFFTEVLL